MKRFSTRCLATLLVTLGFAVAASSAAAAPALQVLQAGTPIAKGSTVTFPSTPTGTPVSILFTIQNNGNANLVINNPTTLVSGSAFFEIVNPTTPVGPGGNTAFRVRLQSGAPGTYHGTVTISSNDPVNPTFTFNLVGTVTGPVLSVVGVSNGSTYTFPNTPVGMPVSVLFTIDNTGTANLTISNPTTMVSGSAFFEIANPTTPIAPGGNTAFRVRLQSGTAGTYNGTVTIDSNDPVTPVFTFNLVGTVTSAPIVSGPTPGSQSVLVGTNVSISVSASGQSPFTYAWSYSTDNVNFGPPLNNGDRSGRITGATSATLQIATTATSDTGYYRCAVTNTYGTTTSASSSLSVTAGTPVPVITDPLPVLTNVPMPPFRLYYPYNLASVSHVYNLGNTGNGTLTVSSVTLAVKDPVAGDTGSWSPPPTLSSTNVAPGATAQLTVTFQEAKFGADPQKAVITLQTNAGSVVFEVDVLWQMREPEQGLHELAYAMSHSGAALDLCDWRSVANNHNDATNPFGGSGASENLPVMAAAVALWVEPSNPTAQGTWKDWWSKFLTEQMGGAGCQSNMPDCCKSTGVYCFKGSELMSHDYTAKVDAAVAGVADWSAGPGNDAALAGDANTYLRAAVGAYGLAALSPYATTGELISENTASYPNLTLTFNSQPMPYVALGGERSCAGFWGGDQRAPVLWHALGSYDNTCKTTAEEPYQCAVFNAASSSNPFMLTSAQLNSLSQLANGAVDTTDVQNVAGLLGSIQTTTTIDFLGWQGVRATCLGRTTNTNTPPTLAVTYDGHVANFIYPYDLNRDLCVRSDIPSDGTCTVDLTDNLLKFSLPSQSFAATLPIPPQPAFHIQVGQCGMAACPP